MNIGIIGCGNMAKALLAGIIEKQIISGDHVFLFDIEFGKAKAVADITSSHAMQSIQEMISHSNLILLAVKPHILPGVLLENKQQLKGKAIISIAAGITCKLLHSCCDVETRILRVMPNTPAMVGEGVTAMCSETTLNDVEKVFAESLFNAVGYALWLSEAYFDAIIGISGSAPAYAYMFIEAMADAGVLHGLSFELSKKLAAQTLLGAAKMVLGSKAHPAELKNMVCSPAGTTIEAVCALEKSGFRSSIIDAVTAAVDKSISMSKIAEKEDLN